MGRPAKLEHEHQIQKLCKAALHGALAHGDSCYQSAMPLYRKRGVQVSLSNCGEIFCFREDYSVLICKQHRTAILNLDKHLLKHHKVPAGTRRQVVDYFSRLKLLDPAKIQLPEEPVEPIEELGRPLAGLQCKRCRFVTINQDQIRRHCKRHHQLAWKGTKPSYTTRLKYKAFSAQGGCKDILLLS